MVIAVVALLVIGPEKLPKVARTVGAFMGRMQRYMTQVKEEVNREMRFEELQKLQQEIKQSVEQKALQIETETASFGAALQPNIHAPYGPANIEQNEDEIALNTTSKAAPAVKRRTSKNASPEVKKLTKKTASKTKQSQSVESNENTVSKSTNVDSPPKKRAPKKVTKIETSPNQNSIATLDDPN